MDIFNDTPDNFKQAKRMIEKLQSYIKQAPEVIICTENDENVRKRPDGQGLDFVRLADYYTIDVSLGDKMWTFKSCICDSTPEERVNTIFTKDMLGNAIHIAVSKDH